MECRKKVSVAVLLSSYNGETFIRDQIESILHQVGDFSLHLIIRDDGSIDCTKNIIETIAKENSNISIYEGKNIGVNASFYELIKIAPKVDYYAISDQDDIWLPEKLQIAISALEENPSKMLWVLLK